MSNRLFLIILIFEHISASRIRLHKKGLAAADVDYPAYGVTGPNKETSPSGDRRLAQSAQMYHYQHQKQQIIAMEHRASNEQRNGSMTDVESDEENEEGDYTVYECPGLAPVSIFHRNASNGYYSTCIFHTHEDRRNGSEKSIIPRRSDSGHSGHRPQPGQGKPIKEAGGHQ